ncbi:MAG: hypothetical protein DSM106950_28035 [Stigonema ocellatum SAG 48.90 = DSM 106950]|nr:hypothetical protein [Stigonema ocellatum SAG 48.90 = DSM 106950]
MGIVDSWLLAVGWLSYQTTTNYQPITNLFPTPHLPQRGSQKSKVKSQKSKDFEFDPSESFPTPYSLLPIPHSPLYYVHWSDF